MRPIARILLESDPPKQFPWLWVVTAAILMFLCALYIHSEQRKAEAWSW